ncbi:MAG: hypothetical protein JWP67_61, partial [Mucilaginibacter sp.]|nr:hypothetical protein [Mucilaginibacter sp.]
MKINPVKESNNGLKYFLLQAKTHWYIFVISLVLFLGLAYAYNTFATQQYLVSSSMLLQQNPNTPEASSQFSNGGVSSVLNVADNIKNEGDVLRSRNLMKEIVQSMHLNMQYFTNSGLLATEIYEEAPFSVQLVKLRVDSLQKRDYVINVVNDTTVKISNTDEGIDQTISLNKAIILPQYKIKVIRRKGVPLLNKEYSVRILSEDDAINSLLAGYDAEFTDKATTTVAFTLYYPNSKKGEAILQNLMNRYLADNISKKRESIDSTIDLINKRIAVVAGELNEIEKNYQNFRSSNDITDINEQSKVLVGN